MSHSASAWPPGRHTHSHRHQPARRPGLRAARTGESPPARRAPGGADQRISGRPTRPEQVLAAGSRSPPGASGRDGSEGWRGRSGSGGALRDLIRRSPSRPCRARRGVRPRRVVARQDDNPSCRWRPRHRDDLARPRRTLYARASARRRPSPVRAAAAGAARPRPTISGLDEATAAVRRPAARTGDRPDVARRARTRIARRAGRARRARLRRRVVRSGRPSSTGSRHRRPGGIAGAAQQRVAQRHRRLAPGRRWRCDGTPASPPLATLEDWAAAVPAAGRAGRNALGTRLPASATEDAFRRAVRSNRRSWWRRRAPARPDARRERE
jgi:hypothetical protein